MMEIIDQTIQVYYIIVTNLCVIMSNGTRMLNNIIVTNSLTHR